jgi:hypothetical protein
MQLSVASNRPIPIAMNAQQRSLFNAKHVARKLRHQPISAGRVAAAAMGRSPQQGGMASEQV